MTAVANLLPAWMYALPRTDDSCSKHGESLREIKGVCDVCLSCYEERTLEQAKTGRATLEVFDCKDLTRFDEGSPL